MGIEAAIIGAGILGAGSSIIGGSQAAGAATDAAQLQAAAANRAADLQWAMFQQTQGNLSPFIRAGQGGLPWLQSLIPGGGQGAGPSNALAPPRGTPFTLPGGQSPSFTPQAGLPGSVGGQPGPAAPFQFDPGSMSPEQLGAFNSYLTSHVRDSLGSQYAAETGEFGEGRVGGAYGPDGKPYYEPNNINVDVTQPGWSLDSIRDLYPGLDEGRLAELSGQGPPPAGALGAPLLGSGGEDSNGGPAPHAPSALNSLAPGAKNPLIEGIINLSGVGDNQYSRGVQDFLYGNPITNPYQFNLDTFLQGRGNPFQMAMEGFVPSVVPGSEGYIGNEALRGLQSLTSGSSDEVQAALEATPGYKFARDQGLKAIHNAASAKGLGISGAAMKESGKFVTGLADQTYGDQIARYLNSYNSQAANTLNAYQAQFGNALQGANQTFNQAYNAYGQRYNIDSDLYKNLFTNAFNLYGQQFGNAMDLTKLGANAAAGTGQIGAGAASAAGGYLTSGAAAGAGGIIGSSNATTNALTGAANAAGQAGMLYAMNRSGSFGAPQSGFSPTTYYPGYGAAPGFNALNVTMPGYS